MGRTHTVKQGDCISSVAFENGFFCDTLWNHGDNAELRSRRSDPHALLAGDSINIPDKREKRVHCATGRSHVFRRKGVPEKLKIQFMLNGEPRANEPFTLDIDGKVLSGTTTAEGKVDEWIDPAAKQGKITFPSSGSQYDLQLGHLDPIEVLSGVQARLANLGLYRGPLDGVMSDETNAAIHAFQAAQGMAEGALDQTTRDALAAAYRDGLDESEDESD